MYSDLLKILLEKRGIKNETQIEEFLNPDYENGVLDPFLMKDMEKVVSRIYEAVKENEKIAIYTDYDCDGIPGAVVMSDLFDKIGYKNYLVYIPDRNSEGYGMQEGVLSDLKEKGVSLIFTIDLGIASVQEVKAANEMGLQVIVTDHHIPKEGHPEAFAILNPKVDEYPEKMLCGAGVVYKFLQAFVLTHGEEFNIHKGWEKWSLDMVGLATLSDMVPLVGENRVLAFYGLKVLRKSKRLGLSRLLSRARLDQRFLSEDDVGFMISPRINAASRMGDAMPAYELLSTKEEELADSLANKLSKINDKRKAVVAAIVKKVKKNFSVREIKEVVVVGDSEWRVGILGLIASKIVGLYDKPAFVWGRDSEGLIRGSARGNNTVSVFSLMQESKDSFLQFGGHAEAGGFSISDDKIHFLEEELSEKFKDLKSHMEEESTKKTLFHDAELKLSDVNRRNWRDIQKLAPYGEGNPKPVFRFPSVEIKEVRKFGKNGSGEHLEITFTDNGKSVKAIAFFVGLDSFTKEIKGGGVVNLLASFDLSRFRGREELRLRIIDIN